MKTKPKISPLNATAAVAANIMTERQWQHRVPMRPQPADDIHPASFPNPDVIGWESSLCHKYGPTTAHIPPMQPGDIFWLREPGRVLHVRDSDEDEMALVVEYGADRKCADIKVPARMSKAWEVKYKNHLWPVPNWVDSGQGIPNGIFKEAARTFREVTRVRLERIQEISVEDCIAEGFELDECIGLSACGGPCDDCRPKGSARTQFRDLWDSLYPGSWDRNDWVLVYDLAPCNKPEGWPL